MRNYVVNDGAPCTPHGPHSVVSRAPNRSEALPNGGGPPLIPPLRWFTRRPLRCRSAIPPRPNGYPFGRPGMRDSFRASTLTLVAAMDWLQPPTAGRCALLGALYLTLRYCVLA